MDGNHVVGFVDSACCYNIRTLAFEQTYLSNFTKFKHDGKRQRINARAAWRIPKSPSRRFHGARKVECCRRTSCASSVWVDSLFEYLPSCAAAPSPTGGVSASQPLPICVSRKLSQLPRYS